MFDANTISCLTPQNFIGVFELDSTGMICYYGAGNNDKSAVAKPNFVRRNFFEEIAAFENGGDFQRRFKCFFSDSFTTDNFNLCFGSCHQNEEFRVKLVRVCERDYNRNVNLVIVDIRKA